MRNLLRVVIRKVLKETALAGATRILNMTHHARSSPALHEQDSIGGLSFQELFDVEEIQRMQDAFAVATGVASIVTDPAGHPITRPSNFSRLCGEIIRTTGPGLERCLESHCLVGCSAGEGVAVSKCLSAGLWNGGVRMNVGGLHIANWLIGQVVDESVDLEGAMAFGREIGAEENGFRSALEDVVRMSRDQFEKIGEALRLIVEQLARQALRSLELEELAASRLRVHDELRLLNSRLEEAKEQAESATRSKSAFLAMMSHELLTPLNGVIGCADLMKGTALSGEQADLTSNIRDSGGLLLGIVTEILEFTSLEECRPSLDKLPVSIAGLVEMCDHVFRKAAAGKPLGFRCEQSPGVPAFVPCDERLIRQVLLRLLGNAIKFTARGTVILRISRSLSDVGPVLEFAIEDTGPGIPPDQLDRLFRPFQQLDSGLHRAYEGAGLGLATSMRLAEAMGGTITVSSTPGAGSVFSLRLPLLVGENSDKIGSGSPPEANRTGHQENLVLVVEDDPGNSFLTGKVIECIGLRADFAFNGADAVAAFVPGKYHAILMDIGLPEMDGIEATCRIRAQESGSRVPIIALTANVGLENLARCLDAGMDGFLEKPFKKGELAEVLLHLGQTVGQDGGQPPRSCRRPPSRSDHAGFRISQ